MRATLTLAFATLAPHVSSAQSGPYLPRVDFDLPQSAPKQMDAVDFDHDGNLDLVITCEGHNSGRVSVLFGDGDADFGTEVELVAYTAWGLEAADFDGDGWADLAVTSNSWAQHTISIFLNDQQRGFVYAGHTASLGSPPVALASGDFDGDSIVDLAVASSSGGNSVDWFKGYGNGTFSAFHTVPYTSGLVGARLLALDSDGDGALDLALAHQTGVKVLRNTGASNDLFRPTVGVPGTAAVVDVVAADVDHDGRVDLVTAEAAGALRIWRNLGGNTFGAAGVYPVGGGLYDLESADLDGNGDLDFMLTALDGVHLLYARANGSLAGPQQIVSGLQPMAGVAGDWNNDGHLDLATACNNLALDAYVSVHEHVPGPLGGTFPNTSGPTGQTSPARHVRR